jgi:6-phosphogluconolactonase
MKITRRILAIVVLAAPVVLFSLVRSAAEPQAPKHPYLVLVGTYTNKTQSKGIYAFAFDAETGKLTAKGVAAETPDPSWVVIHPNGKWAYAANEAGKQSTLSSFSIDAATGKLSQLNQLPALGQDPCHLSFDRTGKFLLAANYSSGNVAVFPILADGKLGEHTALVTNTGATGPDKKRQDGPHAHWIEASAHNRYVYVADLGLDRVLIYKFDAANGTLALSSSATPNPGTGPRHVAFSQDGNFMYVLGELTSTVTVFANDARETWRSIQTISALPQGFSGRNDAAEIAMHPSGKWLYTSNRGHDTLAVFAVEPGKGTLRLLEDVPTGGKEPRHFAIDPTGNYLLTENQNTDTIVTFRIDSASGKLTPTGDVTHVPSPICLAFDLAR